MRRPLGSERGGENGERHGHARMSSWVDILGHNDALDPKCMVPLAVPTLAPPSLFGPSHPPSHLLALGFTLMSAPPPPVLLGFG